LQIVIGAKTYFSLVNAQGSVNGRKLELETRDDGYESSNAAPCKDIGLRPDLLLSFGPTNHKGLDSRPSVSADF
jgi:branched-chain amino acid transport system substrate-binding protein